MKKRSSKLLLLDVNVLVAVAWPNHQFHAAAKRRLESSADRWATCAMTELGFVRLSSNPAAIPTAKSPQEAASLLAAMTRDPLHVYFSSLPSPVAKNARPVFASTLGNKQVTDAYLLWLAHRRHAVFVTFDARLKALAGSHGEVEILGY
jgi:toxin-antitoxin system PIN domain toxin